MFAHLLALTGPWLLVPQPAPEEKLPAPLMRVIPQPANFRGWRLWPSDEPQYGYARDAYGYLRPRIVITPGGDGYYPLTGEPYRNLPTRITP